MNFYAEINLQNKIVPLYNSDYDVLAKLKKNTPLKFEVVQERNYEFHKKVMALFNMAFENQERFEHFNTYRRYLTIKAGYYIEVRTEKGIYVEAESISFANMDQNTFEDLFSKLLTVVSRELKTKPEVIRLQLEDFY